MVLCACLFSLSRLRGHNNGATQFQAEQQHAVNRVSLFCFVVPTHTHNLHVHVHVLLQVTKDLGLPYEDQEYLLEPEHSDWMENIAFSYGKDDPGLGVLCLFLFVLWSSTVHVVCGR